MSSGRSLKPSGLRPDETAPLLITTTAWPRRLSSAIASTKRASCTWSHFVTVATREDAGAELEDDTFAAHSKRSAIISARGAVLASVFTGGLSRLRNAPQAAFAENSSERLIFALSFHKFCELLPEPAPQPDRRLSSNSAMSSTLAFSPPCVPTMPFVIMFKQNGQAYSVNGQRAQM